MTGRRWSCKKCRSWSQWSQSWSKPRWRRCFWSKTYGHWDLSSSRGCWSYLFTIWKDGSQSTSRVECVIECSLCLLHYKVSRPGWSDPQRPWPPLQCLQ